MSRSDIPYALLTLVFGVAIFMAGRLSAPEATQTIIRETVQTAPSVIIVPSAAPQAPVAVATTSAEPPIRLAVLPDAPEPPKVVPTPSQVPVRTPKSVEAVIKTTPKAVPSVPVVLEETPEEVRNPYKP